MAVSKDMRMFLENKERKELEQARKDIDEIVKQNIADALANPSPEVKELLVLAQALQESLINLNQKCGIRFNWETESIMKNGIDPNKLIPPEVKNKGIENSQQIFDAIKEKYRVLMVKISMTSSAKKINALLKDAGIDLGEVED